MKKERLDSERIIRESELDKIINEKLMSLNFKLNEVADNPKNNEVEEIRYHKPLHNEIMQQEKHHKPLHETMQQEKHHKPLHETMQQEKLNLDFLEDYEILLDIFNDELTSDAVIKSLKKSPVEIQIIAKIVINLYKIIEE